ncbi:unnamed protein product [Discosporangium mesarthrocarpum]
MNLGSHKAYSAKTKHIGVHFQFLRDLVLDNKKILKHVSTASQLADLFTKFLPQPMSQFLRPTLTNEK